MQGSCLVHNVLRFKKLRHNYIVIKEQIKNSKNKEKVQIDTSFNHTSSNLYEIFFFFFFEEFPEPSVQG